MKDLFRPLYEEYMKSVTDGFASLCSYIGAEAVIVGGDRVHVMVYKYKEILLEYDTKLQNIYGTDGAHPERVKNFQSMRQQTADKFLADNKLTFEQWLYKFWIGNIYKWGSWEYGWMGNNIVIGVDKKHVYIKSAYKKDDITFIMKEVKPIGDKWYMQTNKFEEVRSYTHKRFFDKLKGDRAEDYTFVLQVAFDETTLKKFE